MTQKRGCPKVVLDTSVLLMVYDGVDVFEEIEKEVGRRCSFLVPNSVISELLKLSNRPGPKGKAARLALEYLSVKKACITRIKGKKGGYALADEEIVDVVDELLKIGEDVVVATNDDDLKQRLRVMKVPILTWWFSKRKFTLT